jgi:hypothetical protein
MGQLIQRAPPHLVLVLHLRGERSALVLLIACSRGIFPGQLFWQQFLAKHALVFFSFGDSAQCAARTRASMHTRGVMPTRTFFACVRVVELQVPELQRPHPVGLSCQKRRGHPSRVPEQTALFPFAPEK